MKNIFNWINMVELDKNINTIEDVKELLEKHSELDNTIFKKGINLFSIYILTTIAIGSTYFFLQNDIDYSKILAWSIFVPMFYAIIHPAFLMLHEHTVFKSFYNSKKQIRQILFSDNITKELLLEAVSIKETVTDMRIKYDDTLYFPKLINNARNINDHISSLQKQRHNLDDIVDLLKSIDICESCIHEFNLNNQPYLIKESNYEVEKLHSKNKLINQL